MEKAARDAALQATADTLAESMPQEQREIFKKDFLEIMQSMNEKIDQRLHQLSVEALPLIQLYIPHRPADAAMLLDQYAALIRKSAEAIMNHTSTIANHAIRTLVLRALHDVIGTCSTSTNELMIRSELRSGLQLFS